VNESGERRDVSVAGELPLTLVVDGREIVTLKRWCLPFPNHLTKQKAIESGVVDFPNEPTRIGISM